MNEADLVAAQDQARTSRAFLSFLTTAFGADQAVPGQDGLAQNTPFQYQVIGPTGVGVEGAPRSTAQPVAGGLPPVMLLALVAAGVLLLAHKA